MNNTTAPVFFLIAGEASGDILGARLIQDLKTERPEATFVGVGGTQMQAAGLKTLFPMEELSVMGIAEVLPRLPNLLRRIKETAKAIVTINPAVVVTIDAPDFSKRVVRHAKALLRRQNLPKIPCVHYVAPTVWAWRAGRAKTFAKLYDGILCLLPFEPPYFEKVGIKADFVGHSVLQNGFDRGEGLTFRAENGIPKNAQVISFLLGSRMGEFARLKPLFFEVIQGLMPHIPNLWAVFPTVPHLKEPVKVFVAELEAAIPTLKAVVTADSSQKANIFAASEAALAASGTVSLELALAGVPTVVAYRVHPVTHFLIKHMVKVKYASLVNIMAEKMLIPEFLQNEATAAYIIPEICHIFEDPIEAKHKQQAIADVLKRLQPATLGNAAKAVLRYAGI